MHKILLSLSTSTYTWAMKPAEKFLRKFFFHIFPPLEIAKQKHRKNFFHLEINIQKKLLKWNINKFVVFNFIVFFCYHHLVSEFGISHCIEDSNILKRNLLFIHELKNVSPFSPYYHLIKKHFCFYKIYSIDASYMCKKENSCLRVSKLKNFFFA
jgi:hypothetical protein